MKITKEQIASMEKFFSDKREKRKGPFKRFLLFHFPDYYPSGGFNDFEGSFDTLEEAKSVGGLMVDEAYHSSSHVIDSLTGKTVQCEGKKEL